MKTVVKEYFRNAKKERILNKMGIRSDMNDVIKEVLVSLYKSSRVVEVEETYLGHTISFDDCYCEISEERGKVKAKLFLRGNNSPEWDAECVHGRMVKIEYNSSAKLPSYLKDIEEYVKRWLGPRIAVSHYGSMSCYKSVMNDILVSSNLGPVHSNEMSFSFLPAKAGEWSKFELTIRSLNLRESYSYEVKEAPHRPCPSHLFNCARRPA